MRKTLTTAALLLALSCPAFAGEMHTPGAPTTPPPQPASTPSESGLQAMAEDGTQNTMTQGTYAQIALELLAVLPSVL